MLFSVEYGIGRTLVLVYKTSGLTRLFSTLLTFKLSGLSRQKKPLIKRDFRLKLLTTNYNQIKSVISSYQRF